MKFLGLILITVVVCTWTSLVYSQEGRPLKPFQEWTKKEAEHVLEESSWAPKQEVRIRYESKARRIAGGAVPSTSEGAVTDTTSTTAEMGGAEDGLR